MMKKTMKEPYSYRILRYVHDSFTEEFVNIGIVLASKHSGVLYSRFNTRCIRVKALFPDVNSRKLSISLKEIQSSFEAYCNRMGHLELSGEALVDSCISQIYPNLGSSLRWSDQISGYSYDISKTFENIYETRVLRYEQRKDNSRVSDSDIWKKFSRSLPDNSILDNFESVVIESNLEEIEFEHSWKNGKWHCLHPLSFDLSSSDYIANKARKWLGSLVGLESSREKFIVHFLVAEPREKELKESYNKALALLKMGQNSVEIVEEDELPKFAESISKEIIDHRTQITDTH